MFESAERFEEWHTLRQRLKGAGVLEDVRWAARNGTINIGLQVAWYHWKCVNYRAKVELNCLYGKMTHE